MSAAAKYTTIAGEGTSLFRDRGSRFLGFSYPISDEADGKARLKFLRKEHPKAAHHCYAFRIGTDGNLFRAVDDGEPAGSAGRPILAALDSAGLTNVLIGVVRYFGGTLLGVPGLINAYRSTAAEALEHVLRVERWVERRCVLHFDYPHFGAVVYAVKAVDGTVYAQESGLFCTLGAGVPLAQINALEQKLADLHGVRIEWTG